MTSIVCNMVKYSIFAYYTVLLVCGVHTFWVRYLFPNGNRSLPCGFLSGVAILATLEGVRCPMRQVSLREFRTRGSKALKSVPSGETVLLAGQDGPAYFLIPVIGDVIAEDRELRRAMAKASLR